MSCMVCHVLLSLFLLYMYITEQYFTNHQLLTYGGEDSNTSKEHLINTGKNCSTPKPKDSNANSDKISHKCLIG